MRKSSKAISFCLTLILIFTILFPFNAYAVSENELRNKVVSVAKGEVGYTGSSSYSKYGEWYGYQGGWCTTFVLWCFNKAGSAYSVKMYANITPSGGNCNSMISWYSSKGRYYKRTGGYKPKAGDLVFFDWSGNGSSQHVGIVSSTSGSTVYTIEGNCSGSVKARSYTTSGSKPYNNVSSIMGYAVPDYSFSGGSAPAPSTNKKTTTKAQTAEKTTTAKSTTKASSSSSTKKKETTTEEKETTVQQVALEKLSLDAATYDLKVGDTVKLNYSVQPSNAPAVVGYFCDDEGIVDIDSSGDITAIGSGKATVVVCANNELYSQCEFNVTNAVGKVTTTVKSAEIENDFDGVGETQKSIDAVLTGMGVNVKALKNNRELFIIPVAIIGITAVTCILVAVIKLFKKKTKR